MNGAMNSGLERAWDFFEKGGVLAWPILACSLIALTVIIERWWTYKKAAQAGDGWFSTLLEHLERADFNGAAELLANTSHPSARLLSLLMEKINASKKFSRASLEKTASHYGSREVRELERHLPTLSTIGNIAPLLGLTGTVLGMVKAFMTIEALDGKVNASVLAGGIWEALLTTLFGLAVAIPAVIAHNYLAAKVHAIAAEITDHAVIFLDAVEEAVNEDGAAPGPKITPDDDSSHEPEPLLLASSKRPQRDES